MRSSVEADVASKTAATIRDYDAVAVHYDAGNRDHDVSQNVEALLAPLRAAFPGQKRLRLLDLGCAGGRDLETFAALGHDAIGVDGSPELVRLARARGCNAEVRDFVDLRLDENNFVVPPLFDGVFANAVLMHVPSDAIDRVLVELRAALRDDGVFFASVAHGFDEDREGWSGGRTPETRSWCCFWSATTWKRKVEAAGFELLDEFYRGRGDAFYATAWRAVPVGGEAKAAE